MAVEMTILDKETVALDNEIKALDKDTISR